MTKKILILISLIFIITSCWEEEKKIEIVKKEQTVCESPFKIGEIDKTSLKLKWVIVSDDIKTISSPMAGTLTYLNCEAWKKVYNKTLIAKVSPDFNNPNIINLSIQKWSLVGQKNNLESVKNSTSASFDTQLSSLDKQIKSLWEQKIILEKNIELTKKSSNLWQNDLKKQIESLKNNLSGLEKNRINLENNLELSKTWEKESLEKIEISKKSLLTNILTISKDNLLKIDEIFWITNENKRLNDKYEDYLWKKDSVLLNKVRTDFKELNSINVSNLSDEEISIFLWNLISLNENVQKSIKKSIENIYFTQTQIDTFYKIFLTYWNNLTEIKNNWDSLDNSIKSIKTNYATAISNLKSQISSLESQIKTTKTNIENLETNKIASTEVSLDLQLSNIEAQLKTIDSNLENLISQKANLKSTKKTQILNLDNQILQINQSINSLNTNLSARNIYAKLNGTVKQKISSSWNSVWINTPICQIIPNTKSTKIKIYSPIELNMWDKLIFEFNNQNYEIIIENILTYKDPATQNYVYESNYLDKKYFKDWEILSLTFNNPNPLSGAIDEKVPDKGFRVIKIPVWYIKNKIDWNFVKTSSGSIIIEKEVKLWDINWNFVEIESWLENIVEVCR